MDKRGTQITWWTKKGKKWFKIFGCLLGVMKNWKGFFELIEGRLKKCHWFLPRISHRACTLTNSLFASSLWHRCFGTPPNLLMKLQTTIWSIFGTHALSLKVFCFSKAAFRLLFLNVGFDVKPVWGLIYSPPLTINTGDLRWQILHGIIAVNAFVSIIKPRVSDKCPFCSVRKTTI